MSDDKREPGAPPDPHENCPIGCGARPGAAGSHHLNDCPRYRRPALVAGSASFSDLLDAYKRACRVNLWDSPVVEEARARVESLHRDEVERLTKQLDGMRGERDAEREIAVEWERKAEAFEEERDEARAELATERERLNVEVDRLIGQCERLTSERDEALALVKKWGTDLGAMEERAENAEARVAEAVNILRQIIAAHDVGAAVAFIKVLADARAFTAHSHEGK